MLRLIRWVIGSLLILSVIGLILFGPNLKMLGWQSEWASRAFAWILFLVVLCLYRIFLGPSAPDRAVAVDMLGILLVGFCAILSVVTGREWYIDIGIAWALQSFIGIMALAKYLENKHFDE